MSHKFQNMLELCRKNFFTGASNMDVARLRFWQELEKEVLQYQSQENGWKKLKNHVAAIGAIGNAEVNRFCILLLDKMETL